jgi:T-complex protein 1 subunit gamma
LIGDDYFTYFIEAKEPKACTIILRGGSKDTLNEMERNLHDALAVVKNIMGTPKLVPGGGAIEMAVSRRINEAAKREGGLMMLPMKAVAYALEVIPRTLVQNSGGDVVIVMTEIRAKHA